MVQPSPKAAHYDASLTAALLRGAWNEGNPGASPNGSQLSWGELIRKWGKHTGGNTALIHYLRDISLLYLSSTFRSTPKAQSHRILVDQQPLTSSPRGTITGLDAPNSSNSSSVDGISNSTTSASASGSSFIHVPHPHLRHRDRATVNTPPADTVISSASGSTIRQTNDNRKVTYLSARDLDGDDSEEQAAWAEGAAWWAGIGIDHVDETKQAAKELEVLLDSGKLSEGQVLSARLTLAFYLHSLGEHETAVKAFTKVASESDPKLGVAHGDAAVLERIRSRCLQGISMELSTISQPIHALQSYVSIIPLATSLTSFPFPTPSYLSISSTLTHKLPFETHREVHRYIAASLARAAIISARLSDATPQTLKILRTYHAYSSNWPSNFRPHQRQRMLQLYLRALFAGYPPNGEASDSPYLCFQGETSLPARVTWRREVAEAMRMGCNLLSSTTTFPRAGSINTQVSAFTELCVGLARKCPSLSREVISVLWWSQTLTFQSQSVLRHLTRLLVEVGDLEDARRTFELYVQLVLKSRQTQQPDVSLQLKRRATEDVAASPQEIKRQAEEAVDVAGSQADGRRSETAEAEGEEDVDFIEALLVGSRLLGELLEPEEAWRYVVLAGDVLQNRDQRGQQVGSQIRARVEVYKGIVRMSMANIRTDPTLRPIYQSQSLKHLVAATRLDSGSPAGFYYLAYCQSEARSISAATESIRSALERDSRQLQYWHLLALLLTAQSDWLGAAKAGEAGISVWEEYDELEGDEDDEEEVTVGNPSEREPAVESRDFATATSSASPKTRISFEPLLKPSGAFKAPHFVAPPLDNTLLSRTKRLQNVIQLRMTLNIITEKSHGPEAAMQRQQDLFAFFSTRSGRRPDKSYPSAIPSDSAARSFVEKGLEESFVSVEPPMPAISEPSGSILPPNHSTPAKAVTEVQNIVSHRGLQLEPPVVVHSAQSSPGASNASSEVGLDEKDADGENRRSSGGHRHLGKHLHVPLSNSALSSRSSSVRRSTNPEGLPGSRPHRDRTASSSSTNQSLAPTVIHSHYRNSNGHTVPQPAPLQSAADHGRTPAESRILSNLWLMSAATFRRWGKPDQCLVSIQEAELLDPENAEVWVQLGLYHMSMSPPAYDQALPAFTKSILLRPDHPSGVVALGKLYFLMGQVELAHSLLNPLTQDAGWDVPEAWYYLGKVCEAQERDERARECWMYALRLEESRPARRWSDALDRWL